MTISTNEKLGLVDTNVLVYRADRDSQYHLSSSNLINLGLRGEIPLCLAPQNLTEFYAVITSPKRVTNPIDPATARAEIEMYIQSQNIRIIYQKPGLMSKVLELLNQTSITRQHIFDLQLVATMLINGVTRIYTFNANHFSPYQGIEVITLE